MLFLTLISVHGKTVESHVLWNIYYHLLLDEETAQVLQQHVTRLLSASESLDEWHASELGAKFRFVNSSTLASVRDLWSKYAEDPVSRDRAKYREEFEAALKHSKVYKDAIYPENNLVYGGARAAAPLGIQTMAGTGLKNALDSWWDKGTTGAVPEGTNIPNPLFAVSLSQKTVLAYGGDPILSYHLATAYAHLAEMLPLRHKSANINEDSTSLSLVKTAQSQFGEWVAAFYDLLLRNLVLRFVTADCLSFCHLLQYCIATGKSSGDFYRRQLSMDILDLDPFDYAPDGNAPKYFDVVDTSNLSDYLGALNILISASPLLKTTPWATLYTETMEEGTVGEKLNFKELLCGPTRTVCTLLGISTVEYWTNATAFSNFDEYILAVAPTHPDSQEAGIQWRFAWKFNEHLSGRESKLPLRLTEEDFVTLVHNIYPAMFANEDLKSLLSLPAQQQAEMLLKHAYPKYHRGSFVAFIKRVLQTVDVPIEASCSSLLKKIQEGSTGIFAWKHAQSLSLQMSGQGVYTDPWLETEITRGPKAPLFSGWSQLPETVAVTIAIPPARWKKFAKLALRDHVAFTVEGGLRGMMSGVPMWHNVFGDVQVTFGTVSTSGTEGSEDFSVAIVEDRAYWSGNSDMIASFQVPTATLQVDYYHTKVSLCLQNTTHNIILFQRELNLVQPLAIFETDLGDRAHVSIARHLPGLDGSPIYNSLKLAAKIDSPTGDYSSFFTANIESSGTIIGITGHLDIDSVQGKKLLTDQVSVNATQVSPFVFEIILGDREAVYTLNFPVPVVKDGSKTRIARKSSYIEIIASLADPVTSPTLDQFIFPSTLAKVSATSSNVQPVPVTLNIPHLNLDTLPIIDVSHKKGLSFLTTLASLTFSARERKLRDEADTSGLAASARMNFKESLFTMFMLASGLQGGQTGLFAINHPERGGIHMLIFISSLRLDGANATVALDGAVIPFTVEIITSGKLDSFLLMLRTLECCTITVDDEDLVLWKKVLPALVERCRTWTYTLECEYARPGATIPLSTEPATQVICSCGTGKLPEDFINLPEWDTAAEFATRLAISPTYAVPFVEEVIDPEMATALSGSTKDMTLLGDQTPACRSCGSLEAKGGGLLRKCMRCLKARYCSVECQEKDWKKHRMECEEAEWEEFNE